METFIESEQVKVKPEQVKTAVLADSPKDIKALYSAQIGKRKTISFADSRYYTIFDSSLRDNLNKHTGRNPAIIKYIAEFIADCIRKELVEEDLSRFQSKPPTEQQKADTVKSRLLKVSLNEGGFKLLQYVLDASMLDFNIDLLPGDKGRLINFAIKNNDLISIKYLFDNLSMDPNKLHFNSATNLISMLHVAASYGSMDTIRYLAEVQKMDVYAKTYEQSTVLHCACNSPEAIKYFWKGYNLNLNAQDKYGKTPLSLTSKAEAAKELLRCGAQITRNDLYHIVKENTLSVMQVLIDHGAVIDKSLLEIKECGHRMRDLLYKAGIPKLENGRPVYSPDYIQTLKKYNTEKLLPLLDQRLPAPLLDQRLPAKSLSGIVLEYLSDEDHMFIAKYNKTTILRLLEIGPDEEKDYTWQELFTSVQGDISDFYKSSINPLLLEPLFKEICGAYNWIIHGPESKTKASSKPIDREQEPHDLDPAADLEVFLRDLDKSPLLGDELINASEQWLQNYIYRAKDKDLLIVLNYFFNSNKKNKVFEEILGKDRLKQLYSKAIEQREQLKEFMTKVAQVSEAKRNPLCFFSLIPVPTHSNVPPHQQPAQSSQRILTLRKGNGPS